MVDPASFELNMKWLADNSVNGVWVNDVAQTGTNLPQSPSNPWMAKSPSRTTSGSTCRPSPPRSEAAAQRATSGGNGPCATRIRPRPENPSGRLSNQ